MLTAASSSEDGEIPRRVGIGSSWSCLNKSPRPKAGNRGKAKVHRLEILASMEVPTRRRGNGTVPHWHGVFDDASMKVPAQRRGNHGVQPR